MKKYKIINGILWCLMNALAIAAIQTIGFPLLNAFERQLSTSMAIDQMSGSAQYIDYAPMIRYGSKDCADCKKEYWLTAEMEGKS